MNSATIKLYLPFGDPRRLCTAEISNWSGKSIAAPRTDLEELFARAERCWRALATGSRASRG